MSFCIECALAYHEFKEILPAFNHDAVVSRREVSPEAWIDGKRYRLGNVASYHVPCDHCRRVTRRLFVPADD
jgi:hypothetical protein